MPDNTPIELWFSDEARIGQKNGVVRQWARKGTRPRQPADQRYENAYLFGAICPALGKGAAIASPWVNTDAMQAHVNEIARKVAPRAHAVLVMDRAAWHATSKLVMPNNITPILLPSYSPELNPVENIWQTVCSFARSGSVRPRWAGRIGCWIGQHNISWWRSAMQQDSNVFIGLDTSKMKISVALAEEGRQGSYG